MSALLGAGGGAGGGLLDSLTNIAAAKFGYKGTPAVGTGIKQVIEFAGSSTPSLLNPQTIAAVLPSLPGVFGGYPMDDNKERAAASVMLAIFSVLALANAFVFFMNVSRKHYFFFTFGILFFNLCKIVGFALRFRWSYNVTQLNVGIGSVVFIQVAQLALLVMNQILAHRIFTWRHPETGSSWWVNLFFDLIYFLVLGIIAMAIIGQALPYLYFLDAHHKKICQNVMQAAAVLNLVYALLPIAVLFLAFAFKPGTLTAEPWKRNNVDRVIPPVAQANWIHSAGLFYYVPRGSQQSIYKDQPAARAIRIIPSREPPANGINELHHEPMHPDSPRFSIAVVIVLISTLVFSLNTSLRVAACFRPGAIGDQSFFPFRYYTLYIFYGATEALVLALFLLLRVDLRFYIPDMAVSAKRNPSPYNGSDYNEPKALDTGYVTPPERA